jgi:uncharacterized protein YcfJ
MSKKILLCALTLALPLVAGATEYRTVERPRQECWNEQVPVQTVGQIGGGTILGGVAGGLLGNQVGGGNGRVVATAIGAVTGAMVGERMSSNTPGYQTVQRCRTMIDYVQVPVVRQPAPIYVQPVPVIEPPVYYVAPAEPVYYPGYPGNRWHEHHRHHHHEDDDD